MRTTFSSELAGLLTDGEQADLEMKFRWRKKVPAKILLELSELLPASGFLDGGLPRSYSVQIVAALTPTLNRYKKEQLDRRILV